VTEQHPVVERYLARLSDGLSDLALDDRQGVMQDIRSHLAEAVVAGTSLEAALESLGPADALARAYGVELLLNPRQRGGWRSERFLRLAGLVVIGSLPALVVFVALGPVGVTFIAAGLVSITAGIWDALGELPSFVQTSGLAPVWLVLIGLAMIAVGVLELIVLRRFVRFVAWTVRAALPKKA
jgi:uncharacterized membrane protein